MKLLTGKCKKSFIEEKLGNNIGLFETMLQMYKHALIIDFFDSVGIYISINREISENSFWNFDFTYKENLNNTFFTDYYETRQQATEEAIKKANEIFNNR